jgi:hypothetical protein
MLMKAYWGSQFKCYYQLLLCHSFVRLEIYSAEATLPKFHLRLLAIFLPGQ